MKKFTIIALALCLALVMAAPVMAVDVDFSGDYRARGFYTEHFDLDKDTATNAYMDMRFRLQTVFKATDNLSVTTRFKGLDAAWGEDPANPKTDFTTFERAYMTIKTDFGDLYIGRMIAGVWGTSFLDGEVDRDRIKYVKTIDNLTLYAVYQKNEEIDGDFNSRRGAYANAYLRAYEAAIVGGATPAQAALAGDAAGDPAAAAVAADAADEDSDTYYLLGKYKMENVTSGLLLAFTNDKTDPVATTHKYTAMPYFVSKFGPLEVQGELSYRWGQTEYDNTPLGLAQYRADGGTAPAAVAITAAATAPVDRDIKELAYNLEATYNFGPASVMAGYAFVSGDDRTDPNEDSAYGAVGDDWEKLFILTYADDPVSTLGGLGNLSQAGTYGAKIIYGGANFSPLDNLELGVVIGSADADEVRFPNQEDDFGVEYDLTLNWNIYDNLSYTAIAAFLSAGDLWKAGFATAEVEDTYAVFHQIQLSF